MSTLSPINGSLTNILNINRKPKRKPPTQNFGGFLSRTRAEEKKKQAVKRLCEKYRKEEGDKISIPSPTSSGRNDLITRLKEHFPGLELDDATSRRLWSEYSRHVQALGKIADSTREETRKRAREATLNLAEKQQQILLKIARREMAQAKRLREENEQKIEHIATRNKNEDAKIQRIRSERYYNDFVDQARARMANKQFGEEMVSSYKNSSVEYTIVCFQ